MSITIRCPGCRYDVTHTQESRCPECGAEFDRTTLRSEEEMLLQRQHESGAGLLGVSLILIFFVICALAMGGAMGASGAGIILIAPALVAIPIGFALAIRVARFGPPTARWLAVILLGIYCSPIVLVVLASFARACRC